MEVVLSFAAGAVFAAAFYALLRRNFLRVVIGFMLISNAINLVIFIVGRLTRGLPPIVPYHEEQVLAAANPLPQALILTAIVISFGVTAFAFTLAYRVYRSLGTLDTDTLTAIEADIHLPVSDKDHEERQLPA